MIPVTLILEIAAADGIRLRRPVQAPPPGFLEADDDWCIHGDALRIRDIQLHRTANGVLLEPVRGAHARTEGEHLSTLWKEVIASGLPDPQSEAPALTAGLVGGGILSPLNDEGDRSRQLDSYREAWIRASGALPDPTLPHEERLLRHLASLVFPAAASLRLHRDESGATSLHLDEAGALERLLDRVRVLPVSGAPASCELRLDRVADVARTDHTAILVAKARAVQLASLAIAFGSAEGRRLSVSVTHAGLYGKVIRLRLAPEGRAAALASLGRSLARALSRPVTSSKDADICPDGVEWAISESAGPVAPGGAAASLRQRRPVAWQPDGKSRLPAWTYAGDDPSVHPRLGLLPFALIGDDHTTGPDGAHPAMPVPDTAGPVPDTAGPRREWCEWCEWLGGARRTAGFRPAFGRLYLQGLEYRLLVEGAAPGEAAALHDEIEAIASLPGASGEVAASAHALLDWLGATGRRPLRHPAQEGRLAALAALGQRVAQGEALDAPHLWAFVRHHDPDLQSQGYERLLSRFERAFPEGLRLRPSAIRLRAAYASISGACDQREQPLGLPGVPVPDLRADRRLRAALLRIGGPNPSAAPGAARS